ncbi:uncharacterized protein [Venturia canescens]|nr:uncharacterized protein LOC122411473 isoform X2 [Venturia canescens]
MDLAILVGRYKSAHGFKHKDILTLSHIDFINAEVAKQVVFVYALHGLNAASLKFKNELEAKNQLDYLKRVEELRTCKDPTIVAEILSNSDFTIDHVHPSVLRDENVWKSLLPGMDIRSVLKYLPKITQLGFLKKGSTLTEIIIEILTDWNNLSWNKILPGEILKILNLYEGAPNARVLHRHRLANVEYEEGLDLERLTEENCFTDEARKIWMNIMERMNNFNEDKKVMIGMGKEKKKIKKKTEDTDKNNKMQKKPVKIKSPNVQVKQALQTALNLSQKVDITACNEKYYVVGIKMPSGNPKNISSCSEVGLTIALPLLHRNNTPEDSTTVIFYDPKRGHGFVPEILKEWSFDETLVHTLNLSQDVNNIEIPLPLGPMCFCKSEKRKCDVFINVTNLPPTRPPPENSVKMSISLRRAAMNSILFWKKYLNFQQTRYINILLNQAPFELKGSEWDEILTIRGFDTNVPFIIEAYVRGLF